MSLAERRADFTDTGFICGCLLYGARKGHYSFDPNHPVLVDSMRSEIQSVIARQMLLDQRRATALVFSRDNKRVAVLIMSEAEPGSNSLELYALSITQRFQNRGFGSRILDSVLRRYAETDIYARCSPASGQMQKMLMARGFALIDLDGDHRVLQKEAVFPRPVVGSEHSAGLAGPMGK